MFFFGLPAILVAIYGWKFRILQTVNEYQKSTQQGKLVRNFFEVGLRNAAGASVILVRLCFSSPCITPVSLALYAHCKCLMFPNKLIKQFQEQRNHLQIT